ncbi:nad-dependent deacetylase sirtuin-5 [Colletotrichum incanum]|uniref:Nad-dependent deacetylase sirtuin-5 n=1 Tax=Colletotrichum incanum TaxID=1573173 RepID=A0A166Z2M5_COLIC|nr:nad-dependent deacetylase sirtuin-5 [Colletotrichum incanum]OHW97476.1 NAD-dependent deacetylase sirtuin-5 [Colletotrichum incanum]
MADSPRNAPNVDSAAVADFYDALKRSQRVIAVIGAGLSGSSGLVAFRRASGPWEDQDVTQVASAAAHYALPELALRVPDFVALTQNADNLSPRVGHLSDQLRDLRGNLFTLSCFAEAGCNYVERANFDECLMPALSPSKDERIIIGGIDTNNKHKPSPLLLASIVRKSAQSFGDKYQGNAPTIQDLAVLKPPRGSTTAAVAAVWLSSGLAKEDSPHCLKCKKSSLRPGSSGSASPYTSTRDED